MELPCDKRKGEDFFLHVRKACTGGLVYRGHWSLHRPSHLESSGESFIAHRSLAGHSYTVILLLRSRSAIINLQADVAQLAERKHGKFEAPGSIPGIGSHISIAGSTCPPKPRRRWIPTLGSGKSGNGKLIIENRINAGVSKWPNECDCKSHALRLRGFESLPQHQNPITLYSLPTSL